MKEIEMHRTARLVNLGATILGVAAAIVLLLSYAPLEYLRSKMVAFETLSPSEEGMLNILGVALLLALAFCLIACALLIRHIWKSQRLSLFHLIVIAGGILAPMFVLADLALISDISRQYRFGLAQPEWSMLYFVLAAQIIAVVCLLYALVFTIDDNEQSPIVTRDGSLLLIVHYVGALCGMLGFAFVLVNILYPRPVWVIQKLFPPTLITILAPYILMIVLWLVGSSRSGGWLDEKARNDAGVSAFIAASVSLAGLTVFYIAGFITESSILTVLWYPFAVFLLLMLFSVSNLYMARDNLRLVE